MRGRGDGTPAAHAAALAAHLSARLGRPLPPPLEAAGSGPPARLDSRLDRLAQRARSRLARVLGSGLAQDEEERWRHAFGGGLGEALRRAVAAPRAVPDAVAAPADEGEVVRLLELAAELELGLEVCGGGTQAPARVPSHAGPRHALLALSTRRLVAAPRLEAERTEVTVGAGVPLGALERALRGRGFTLGADPATPPARTVGGWLAGGGFDVEGPAPRVAVRALRVATPMGVLRLDASSSSPLAALLEGSGGRLGVLVEATLRVRRVPASGAGRGLSLREREEALALLRALAEAGPREARLGLGASGSGAAPTRSWLGRRAAPPGSALALEARLEGEPEVLRGALRALRRAAGRRLARIDAAGPAEPGAGAPSGAAPDDALRAALLERGVALGSVTATLPWGALPALPAAVDRTLEAALEVQAGGGVVRHRVRGIAGEEARVAVDLLYPVDPSRPCKPWEALREAAAAALARAGARVAPAHCGPGEGPGETADLAGAAWRAVAGTLDPASVLRSRNTP